MTMKQTQTKLFDFSDVGLDFCAGSKNLFPDRFKKMLSLGYNEQTVSSVSATGNQVVLTYGVSHGYVADRVLKITSGALAAINNGEFWIDSVTANTVTLTIDDAPISVAGGFVTKIASLGWQLVYEQAAVHIYKLKNLDESDLFLRLCFQTTSNYRNVIAPCAGKTANLSTGEITDIHAVAANANITTPARGLLWEFQQAANATMNSYTFTQGYSTFGNSQIVGSLYHFAYMGFTASQAHLSRINALLPSICHAFEAIQRPLLIANNEANNINSVGLNTGQDGYIVGVGASQAYVGAVPVVFETANVAPASKYLFQSKAQSNESFLSSQIETFNITTAAPLRIFEKVTSQFLGYAGGVYTCFYANAAANKPAMSNTALPLKTMDLDQNSPLVLHPIGANNDQNIVFFTFPIEEIKLV